MIGKMAFRNLKRNKGRTIVVLVSISVAVMFACIMLSLINGMIDSYLNNYKNFQYGDIRVANKKFFDREQFMPIKYSIDESIADSIGEVKGIVNVSKRIKMPVLLGVGKQSENVILFGADLNTDEKLLKLNRSIKEGNLPNNGRTCIVGENLAKKMNIKTGDSILIVGSDRFMSLNAVKLVVSGVFDIDIPYFNRKFIFTSYRNVQMLGRLGKRVTEIVVFTKGNYHKIADKINKEIPGNAKAVTIDRSGGIYVWMKLALIIYQLMSLAIVFLGAMVIINTMLMVVNERKREIGTLKALGMSDTEVEKLFMSEAFYMGGLGSLIGVVAGGFASYFLATHGFDFSYMFKKMEFMFNSHMYGQFSIPILISMFFVGVIVSTFVTYLPVKSEVSKEVVDLLER
ncbi:MAG: FtsX-like permease family protein [Proteobacteria bacterium]|nr:FtsX-like permease family protein [Pseudomonadota bacterium]